MTNLLGGKLSIASLASVSISAIVIIFFFPAAAQTPEDGEKVFKRYCKACHAVGPKAKNRSGPVLNGIVGRTAGTVEGYKYSKANAQAGKKGWVWTEEVLLKYLANPRKAMPRNKMGFPGLKKDKDRKAVVAYLKTLTNTAADGGTGQTTKADTSDTKANKTDKSKATKEVASMPAKQDTSATSAAKQTPDATKTDGTANTATSAAGDETGTATKAAAAPVDAWIVGGATPSARPEGAPRLENAGKDGVWYDRALVGLSTPYPPSFRFLEDQGRWHTPFNHPGMTGPYDIRGWHTNQK